MVTPVMTAGFRIAVIDDDEDVREALAATFASAGFEAVGYTDAESFLAIADRPPAACVVSDVQMPGMGGLELAGHLRSRWPDVPVVLITAFADDAMRRRAEKAGVLRFYEKPFDPDDLLRCVSAALGR